MTSKKAIAAYLKKKPTMNVNIINFIENYPIQSIQKIGNSVVVKGMSDRNWVYVSSESVNELKMIQREMTSEERNFAVIED